MEKNPDCIVEQIIGNRAFLVSVNDGNHFWVDINNDSHWGVVFNT